MQLTLSKLIYISYSKPQNCINDIEMSVENICHSPYQGQTIQQTQCSEYNLRICTKSETLYNLLKKEKH